MRDMRANLIDRTRSAYAYPLLIKQLLHTPLAVNPEQEIVYRDQKRYNYWTLRHRVGQLASGLSALCVRQGDTVAIMDWDSHRYLETYFAVPMMGAVLMTVNMRLTPEQLAYTLNHSGANVLLVNAELLPILDQIKDHLEGVRHFILIDDTERFPIPPGFSDTYEVMLAAGSPDFVFDDFDENTRATTFYTTGTTGLPKGVYFSHRQLVLLTLSAGLAFGSAGSQGRIHRDDVYMPITPMFHVHAWSIPFIATLLGLKQVYPGRYAPEILLELIRREKVTLSHGVPTIVNMMLSHPDADKTDLRGWKVIVGGSALPRSLAQAALKRGIDIFAGYGMSETGPIMAVSHIKAALQGSPEHELDLRTRAGLSIPLVDLRIVDPEMRDVAHDGKTVGEIVVRAPWATQGYFKNPEASEILWEGGYLHTNDIGVIDSDGYLQITDRLKDVIKTGGEWVSSIELEDLILRHPAVAEAAVIGVKDDKWGERPLAVVVLKPSEDTDAESIRSHVAEFVSCGTIPKFAIPERILFVPELEKTSVGKLDKKILRQRYGSAS
jgi:fatty-acyl-CoA synthase